MTGPQQVVVMDDYQQVIKDAADWGRLGPDTSVSFLAEHLDGPRLIAALVDAEVVIAVRERTPLPADVLDQLPNLRLIITAGMQNASIDVGYARSRGIEVCGTHGSAGAAAELTWALILGLLRQVPAEDRSLRAGGWQTTVGHELADRTLGVIGLGRLGSKVAAVGRAFGMDVIAWSTNLDPAIAREQDVEPVSKDELLSRADVVSLHLRLSDRSRATIGARELSIMKPTAYLINTSRGPLVDETALIDALENATIAGAGLDVYDIEPLPSDHRLRHLPNTVLTPHLGYVTEESYQEFFGNAVEDIIAWRDGAPVRRVDAAGL